MSGIGDYERPFKSEKSSRMFGVVGDCGCVLCDRLTAKEAEELCSILNAHFAPKKIQKCEKCMVLFYATYPEPSKYCSCGTELIWVDPPSDTKVSVGFTAPAPDPQPNIAPPEKEHQVWDVFRSKVDHGSEFLTDTGKYMNPDKALHLAARGSEKHSSYLANSDWKIVGTLQGEVEK